MRSRSQNLQVGAAGTIGALEAIVDAKPESKGCTIEMVRAAKPAAQKAFAAVGNLVGIGITRMGAGYGLKVNLESAPDGETSLPAEIAGVPVRVEIVGLPTKRTAGR